MDTSYSFPEKRQLKPSEVVWFSWIVYESRSHRDQVNAKIMSDPRIAKMHAKKPPFDPKRMFYGGFNLIVSM